ncbi:hypothetical protein BH24ACT22_BH24ACT22_18960 [soil metagenome]
MPRWIIPASVFTILISLAALGILLATNSAAPPEDVADTPQVEEPETSPQPTPEQETEREVDPENAPQPEEEEILPEEQTTQEDPTSQGEQTTQQTPTLPGPRTAVVRITGGAAYYCNLGVIGESETIQGRQPASYEVEVATGGTALETVTASCQKISPGTLEVQIRYDGEVVVRDQTDARLGTVTVAWNPLQE